MKVNDLGVSSKSVCFSFTPSDLAKKLCFYPTWCGHYYCNDDYFIKRNRFPSILVAFIRSGSFYVEYNNEVFNANKGDVILLDCTYPHYYKANNKLEFVYMNFKGSNAFEICNHILKQIGPLIQQKNNTLIGNELYDMVHFYVQNGVESMMRSSMRIYKILDLILTPDIFTDKQKNPIKETIVYIKNNFGNNITVEQLAAKAQISPFYYAHLFKEQTGFSPIEYVITIRMDQAKVLLVETLKSIEEIAYIVGYNSSSSFIKLFTKKMGISPKRYRMMYQSKLNK